MEGDFVDPADPLADPKRAANGISAEAGSAPAFEPPGGECDFAGRQGPDGRYEAVVAGGWAAHAHRFRDEM